MKTLPRSSALLGVLLLGAGCGAASSTSGSAFPATGGGDSTVTGDRPAEAAPSGGTGSPGGTGTGTASAPIAGPTTGAPTTGAASMMGTGAAGAAGTTTVNQGVAASLTAGTWDDNLNFAFYEKYLASMNASQVDGFPLIDRAGRLEITVLDAAGTPLAGAHVDVSDATGKLFETTSRGDGKLFFFPGAVGAATGDALTITATLGQATATLPAHAGDATAGITLAGAGATPVAALDLAIVVDTTGSMGDELSYLESEMSNIIARVSHDFPNVAQRWSAIFYRDTVDEYVVRAFDFTDSVDTLKTEIAAQSAGGGGDFPEAPDQALARLSTLSWRPGAVARMAFWVADAPHHAAQAQTMVQDFLAAQHLGIRIYPVAASGTDDLLEYTMRTAAEVTGGRYLFLTNDSGIGDDHKEPTIPCYLVTTLDKAMLRMIGMELTGKDDQPAAADILRTSGAPKDGTCVLAGGQIVTVL